MLLSAVVSLHLSVDAENLWVNENDGLATFCVVLQDVVDPTQAQIWATVSTEDLDAIGTVVQCFGWYSEVSIATDIYTIKFNTIERLCLQGVFHYRPLAVLTWVVPTGVVIHTTVLTGVVLPLCHCVYRGCNSTGIVIEVFH